MDTSPHLNPALVNAIRLNTYALNHQTLESQTEAPVINSFTAGLATAQLDISPVNVMVAKQLNEKILQEPGLSTRLDWVPWINPDLAAGISKIRMPIDGVPRSQITVPISPSGDVTDELLFEAPTNANQKYYLPRYRIAERNRQIQIAFAPSDSGWSLTIHLEKYPAPALSLASRDAQEIPHTVSLILQHRLVPSNDSSGQKQLVFESPIAEAGGLRAVLQVASLNERDLLYQVLTMPEYGAMLTIQRAVQVALLVPVASNPGDAILSSGTGTLRGTWLFNFDTGAETNQGADIWWEQKTNTERWLMPQGQAKIINLGVCDFDAITLAQLQGLAYSPVGIDGSLGNGPLIAFLPALDARASIPLRKVPIDIISPQMRRIPPIDDGPIDDGPIFVNRNQLVNGDVFAVLTNQGNYAKVKVLEYGYNLQIQWVTYSPAVAAEPLFRVAPQILNDQNERNPFVFPANLYDYIFTGITGTTGKTFKPDLRQVNGHSYYQDPVERQIFYYLPDQFKLVRRPESPHYPMVSLRVASADGSDANLQVTIDYWAAPFVDQNRLNAAAADLSNWIPKPLPAGVTGVVFQALVAEHPRLFLNLPNPDGSQSTRECPEVLVELRSGFRDSRTLPLAAFQAIYDALFSEVTQLFQGQVKVEFPSGPTEIIPFNATINDLLGKCFDDTKAIDPNNGAANVILKNAIESPLQINTLSANLRYGNTSIAGILSALSTPLPAIVNRGENFTLTVTPSDLSQTNLTDVVLDYSGVQVVKDPDAVLGAIMNVQTLVTYTRQVSVTAIPQLFQPPSDHPDDPIMMILVDFLTSGETLSLTPAVPTQTITLRLPVKNFILNQIDIGAYHYQATFVYGHRPPVKGEIQVGKIPLFILEVK